MGLLALYASATGRQRTAPALLSGSVLLLVLIDPALARAPGFALSVLATAGIVALAPPLADRLARRWPRWLAETAAVPIAAQLACAPLLAALFGALSLVAVPANLVAMPAVGAATIGGVVAALLQPVVAPLARVAAWLAGVPTGWLVRVARTGAGLPHASVRVPTGLTGAVVALVLLGLVGWALRRPLRRHLAVAATCGLVGAGLAVPPLVSGWPPGRWVLVACDVGQGDGLVVRAPQGGVVVIDTGPDPAAMDSCLADLGVHRVSAVVLTHLHADHVEGLPAVLRRRVGEVVVGPLDEPVDERDRVLAWAGRAHVPVRRAADGERWQAGGVDVTVLGPAAAFHGTDSDPNNSSLILAVHVDGLRLLLTGDIEQAAQTAALARGAARYDVLKVPHHGSAKQLDRYLAAAGARVAIVSVGADNPYGHPARSTLGLLAMDGARSYRTDRDGDVAVVATNEGPRVIGRRGSGTPPDRPPPLAWTLRAAARALCPVRPNGPAARQRAPPGRWPA
jgi:competence protein ComEC